MSWELHAMSGVCCSTPVIPIVKLLVVIRFAVRMWTKTCENRVLILRPK